MKTKADRTTRVNAFEQISRRRYNNKACLSLSGSQRQKDTSLHRYIGFIPCVTVAQMGSVCRFRFTVCPSQLWSCTCSSGPSSAFQVFMSVEPVSSSPFIACMWHLQL